MGKESKMSPDTDRVFFAAGHGLYSFHVDSGVFNRSLYYNLLLQPSLVAPDHFFLQDGHIIDHLNSGDAGNTWIEIALKNGWLIPYLRDGRKSFAEALDVYVKGGLKGCDQESPMVAEHLDSLKIPRKCEWNSRENSVRFRRQFQALLDGLPDQLPQYARCYGGKYEAFLKRSGEWRYSDVKRAREIADDHECLPVSFLVDAAGERLFPEATEKFGDIGKLLAAIGKDTPDARQRYEDTKLFFVMACEYYNGSLADSLLVCGNTPGCGEEQVVANSLGNDRGKRDDATESTAEEVETAISLPLTKDLMRTPGQTFESIRKTKEAQKYFEALAAYKSVPCDSGGGQLIESLESYSRAIVLEVGQGVRLAPWEACLRRYVPKVRNAVVEVSRHVPEVLPWLAAADVAIRGLGHQEYSSLYGIGALLVTQLPDAVLAILPEPRRTREEFDVRAQKNRPGVGIGPDVTWPAPQSVDPTRMTEDGKK
jgi:hypothetical protein